MNEKSLLNQVLSKAKSWTNPPHDLETRELVKSLIDRCDSDAMARERLIDSFYTDLSFGTGGMRGKMGPGTNRINATTIANATQGLANHLLKRHGQPTSGEKLKVAIACDSRHRSQEFAQIAAEVLAANGLEPWIYPELRPTPQLSWTVRELGAVGGVVVTASHNPPEYNGYKVYGSDGGQVVFPEDAQLVEEVRAFVTEKESPRSSEGIRVLDASWDKRYRDMLQTFCLSQDLADCGSDMPIVYTGLHGTGGTAVPPALKAFGFRNVHEVEEQAQPDGAFPTVKSPNPEEGPALAMAVQLAKEVKASLVMGTDPDSDRVGLAVPSKGGEYILLNGNETAALLVDHVLSKWNDAGKLNQPSFIAKTIVTTNLLVDIAKHYQVMVRETLTGFKHIAAAIRDEEGSAQYVAGGEESYGYLVGDCVRDKDAVQSCCLLSELAHELEQQGEGMLDRLAAIHRRHGAYKEGLISLVKEGREGKAQIDEMIRGFRESPPSELAGEKVTEIHDFLESEVRDPRGHVLRKLTLSTSNVIQFVTDHGSRITVRPSGTEPKVKCYVSVRDAWEGEETHAEMMACLQHRVEQHFLALGVPIPGHLLSSHPSPPGFPNP